MPDAFEEATSEIVDDGLGINPELENDTFTDSVLGKDDKLKSFYDNLEDDKKTEFSAKINEVKDAWIKETGAQEISGVDYSKNILEEKLAEDEELSNLNILQKEDEGFTSVDTSKLTEDQIKQLKEDGFLDLNGDGKRDAGDAYFDLNDDDKIGKADGDFNDDGIVNAKDKAMDFRTGKDENRTTDELEEDGKEGKVTDTKENSKKKIGMKEIMAMIQQIAKLIPKQKPAPKPNPNAQNVSNPGYDPVAAINAKTANIQARTQFLNTRIAQVRGAMRANYNSQGTFT